jgi:glycosyltransferase involved in cell wall biosynthesis
MSTRARVSTESDSEREDLRVLLVDPSLFTAPYDAALDQGLVSANVSPTWVVRPARAGEKDDLPAERALRFFYRRVDEASWLPERLRGVAKGLAHAWGLWQLGQQVQQRRPEVVHFQWMVVPLLDALAILYLRRFCTVVATVHDTLPFNGERITLLQNLAVDLPVKLCAAVIVHTEAGKARLAARGISSAKINVVPHGPLALRARPTPGLSRVDDRWTFLLFGELKPYKGVDVLVEAVGLLPAAVRAQVRVVIAGRPRMELGALRARIAELGVGDSIELQPKRLSEQEMADLFAKSDCFLFPYRQIDASGVYFLVKSLGKWLIASRVGVFAEDLRGGQEGELLPAGDATALAAAMERSASERRQVAATGVRAAWDEIGQATRGVYRRARHEAVTSGDEPRPPSLYPSPLASAVRRPASVLSSR